LRAEQSGAEMISWLLSGDNGCDKDSVRAFSELESKRLIAVHTNIDYYKKRMNEIQQEQAALTLQLQSLSASSTPNKTTPSKSEPYTHSTSPTKTIPIDEDEDDMYTSAYTDTLSNTSTSADPAASIYLRLQQLYNEQNKVCKELDLMEKTAKQVNVTFEIEMIIVNFNEWFHNIESKMEKCRYDNAERQHVIGVLEKYKERVLKSLVDGERLLDQLTWHTCSEDLEYALERVESLRSKLLALDSTDKSH